MGLGHGVRYETGQNGTETQSWMEQDWGMGLESMGLGNGTGQNGTWDQTEWDWDMRLDIMGLGHGTGQNGTRENGTGTLD